MLEDKYSYPIECEVKVLEFTSESTAHSQKEFNEATEAKFGSSPQGGYQITPKEMAQNFWKNSFLRENNNRVQLTKRGQEYLENMREELGKIKSR